MAHLDPSSSILYQNDDASIIVLDIPRSLEESQVLPGEQPFRRLCSTVPPAEPFSTPEPRGGLAGPRSSPAAQVADLMTAATAQLTLDHLAHQFSGPFCLTRATEPICATLTDPSGAHLFIPPAAHYLAGSVQDLRQTFLDTAPRFDVIVLDPPWPNRSARRRTDRYATMATLHATRDLFTSIPVADKLAPDGLVAIWITNKERISKLLTGPAGVFTAWGLELVAEWTWLKVTPDGQPLFALDATWRKPWEKMFIARSRSPQARHPIPAKTIVAVPDLHSRKPNLRRLFQDLLGKETLGLEIFARNLTAGWWGWGAEVLCFQRPQNWLVEEENGVADCINALHRRQPIQRAKSNQACGSDAA